jgi:hypothetical protein
MDFGLLETPQPERLDTTTVGDSPRQGRNMEQKHVVPVILLESSNTGVSDRGRKLDSAIQVE